MTVAHQQGKVDYMYYNLNSFYNMYFMLGACNKRANVAGNMQRGTQH
jgi:hypothetical protein